MSDKKKPGPHGPDCECDEEEKEYVDSVNNIREMIVRELIRYTAKQMDAANPVTPEEEHHVKMRLRDATLVALALELSEGLFMSGLDTADAAAFFLKSYERERNKVLLRNAQFVGVVPVNLKQEEQTPRPDPKAN